MKILIIANRDINEPGGVETYNKKLFDIFKQQNIDCKLLVLLDYKNNKQHYNNLVSDSNYIKKLFSYFTYRIRSRKLVYQEIAKNNYDLIIDSTFVYYNKIAKKDNYIWVQHTLPKWYYGSVTNNGFINFFIKFFNKLTFVGDFFCAKNVVMYDENNLAQIKNKSQQTNYFFVPLAFKDKKDIINTKINYSNKKRFVYMGRVTKVAKNVSLLNKLNQEIYVYGSVAEDGNKLLDENKIKMMGAYKKCDIDKIMDKTKFLLLPSNYEGFSFCAVEAISCGVPVLLKDSFPSAKNLSVDDDLLLAKDDQDFIKKFDNLKNITDNKYQDLVEKCLKKASTTLNNDYFKKQWLNIIKKCFK